MNEGILIAYEVYSFTKQVTSTVSIAGKFLDPADKVLIIDDFLSKWSKQAKGLIHRSSNKLVLMKLLGIVIEKSLPRWTGLVGRVGISSCILARSTVLKWSGCI